MIAISALTSINATIIVGARTSYAMGRDWPIAAQTRHMGYCTRYTRECLVGTVHRVITARRIGRMDRQRIQIHG